MTRILLLALAVLAPLAGFAQVDDDQWGAWYILNWNYARPDRQWGFQGDIQHRHWDMGGDLEQLLIRGGFTWQPAGSTIKYTFGYANVKTGVFGPDSTKSNEHRLYQEALIPQKLGERGFLTHRLRFEQRDLNNQDLRTRLRYFLGLNYPLNQATLGKGAFYVALSNEFFLNLETGIGNGRRVDYVDRNRFSAGVGYSVSERARVQFAVMNQRVDAYDKSQIQLSWTQNF